MKSDRKYKEFHCKRADTIDKKIVCFSLSNIKIIYARYGYLKNTLKHYCPEHKVSLIYPINN